jgi:short-subunit dehydrogenase
MRLVITGASSGLGRALALEFARRFPGARMMLVARRADRLAELAARLPGVACDCVALDVADAYALRTACHDFVGRHGAPDIVVANAGISAGTVTGTGDDRAVFRRIVEVNLLAMVETFDPFIGPMRDAGGGILVGIGSVAGVRGLPGAEAYSASKAAVHSYLESLRVGMRGSGIAVVTLAPGYIRTEMTAHNQYPMPFLMPAEDFARRAVDAILARRAYVTIPWPMGWVARLLRLLPNWLYDRAFAKAPRKARDPGLAANSSEPAGDRGTPP